MHVMGISCYFHDAAAALLRDGQLVAAAEEERFSRVKHDLQFPSRAIRYCLGTAQIQAREVDYVVFFEKPFLKFERLLVSAMQTFPRSRRLFQEGAIGWLADKLWIKSTIQREFGIPASRILFSEHHTSHAASAFLCSPFPDAALLTVDGVGEWTTAAIGIGTDTQLALHKEIRFPHSLGLLYSAFTAFLGFQVNEGEYKVMGMAAFGRPRYADAVRKLIRVAEDASFRLNLDYFEFHRSTHTMFGRKFEELFGAPRAPGTTFSPGDPASRRYADLAASVQAVTEEVVVGLAREARRHSGLPRLCMAGGVALNSVANTKVLRSAGFDEIFIQPAAGDSGGALGAALYGWHTVLGKPRGFVMRSACWGPQYTTACITGFLDALEMKYESYAAEQSLLDRVTAELAAGKVVGWFSGRGEWGPRALGNRSILADPRQAMMRDRVNRSIKYREPFRPFAPSVLEERSAEYFDFPDAGRHLPARFMLYVAPVRESYADRIPAVTHVDGTARLQVVGEEWNPRYYRLIRTFGDATGIPVLLNTSFNVQGEPIVNRPAEALQTWQGSGMDVLVLENCVLKK